MYDIPSKENWGRSVIFDQKYAEFYQKGHDTATSGFDLNYPFSKTENRPKEMTFKDICNFFYYTGYYHSKWHQ
jgi:hypothetical protein